MFINPAAPNGRLARASCSTDGARRSHAHYARFIQPDPIRYDDGMNMYAYVGNDPVNKRDPLGLQQVEQPPVIVTGRRLPRVAPPRPCPTRWECSPPSDIPYEEPFALQIDLELQLASFDGVGGPLEERISCAGRARVMAGNPGLVGRIGGFGFPVTAGSAAIIPRQFTRSPLAGPSMRYIGRGAWGMTEGGQMFWRFTDTMDHNELAPRALDAQDIIMARDPGLLILELVSGRDEGVSFVTLSIPATEHGCPTGTRQIGGG